MALARHQLIIPEPPLQLLPTLAKDIGIGEALILQQLHYLTLNENNGKVLNGERWIYNTYEDWQSKYFPFWSTRTIKTYITSMEERELIISCQPEGRKSRRKYYRLSDEWNPLSATNRRV